MLPYHADIGANLTDDMFQGKYMGKEYHGPDLPQVFQRAWAAGKYMRHHHCLMFRLYHVKSDILVTGLQRIIVTAGSLPEAKAALKLAQTDGNASY